MVGVGRAAPAQAKTFAMVFKVLNNAFTPPLQAGCKAAAEKLNVTCTFMGPQEYNEASEVQMAQDMVQKGVDGLAVSAGNPKAMERVLQLAKERHIPVVTFDSDVLPQDAGLRATFIGTDNYLFGAKLADLTKQLKPKGGTVCIQSGAPASLNLNDRIQGIRDTLAGAAKDAPVKRLTGQNGWTEPAGCPVYNNDDVPLAARQMFDVFTANPKLDAFVAVGGWAQYAPQAYRQAVELAEGSRRLEGSGDRFRRQFRPADAAVEGRHFAFQCRSAPVRYGLQGDRGVERPHRGQTGAYRQHCDRPRGLHPGRRGDLRQDPVGECRTEAN